MSVRHVNVICTEIASSNGRSLSFCISAENSYLAMVRSREAHKDFVNWGDGVLSSQDPSEMMKPLIYDEFTSVVYAEYRMAKKFDLVSFLSVATLFLLAFSQTSRFTSPPPFPRSASSTSAAAAAPPRCTPFSPFLPPSSVVERFPSLQQLVLVDSSEYMLSQSTSLLNARRSALSCALPSITTYASLLSVLEEVALRARPHPEGVRLRPHLSGPLSERAAVEQSAHLRHRRRLGYFFSLLPLAQSCFARTAFCWSPKRARAGASTWCAARARWCCEWRRRRGAQRCWRPVRTAPSARCATTGRTGAASRSRVRRDRRP